MATTLANGVRVWNATPHALHFVYQGRIQTVMPDGIINCTPVATPLKEEKNYVLNTVKFNQTEEGRSLLQEFKEKEPQALIVGSVIAAQAYPEEIVAPVPTYVSRNKQSIRLVESDRFTVFKGEESNG